MLDGKGLKGHGTYGAGQFVPSLIKLHSYATKASTQSAAMLAEASAAEAAQEDHPAAAETLPAAGTVLAQAAAAGPAGTFSLGCLCCRCLC